MYTPDLGLQDFTGLHWTTWTFSDFIRLYRTSVFIGLHRTSPNFIVLRRTSLDFIGLCELRPLLDYTGLCWTTPDFVGLHWTTSDFIGLHVIRGLWTSLDYTGLHQTSRNSTVFKEINGLQGINGLLASCTPESKSGYPLGKN